MGNHLRIPMQWLGAGASGDSTMIGNSRELVQRQAIKLQFVGTFMKIYSFELGVGCG